MLKTFHNLSLRGVGVQRISQLPWGWTKRRHTTMSSKPVKGSDGTFRYREIEGDLFQCPDTSSLAHCVSTDLYMSKGIATKFRNMFKGEDDLWNQNEPVGGCAKLERGKRYVYYLITKKIYRDKPTYDSLRSSLSAMARHCEFKDVKELSMPQIGCGLDGLKWPQVSSIIKEVFKDTSVNITVYITDMYGGPRKPKKEKQHSTKGERSPNSYGTDPEKPESYYSAPGYREIEGDLFESPETSSLAHCVSYDLKMGKGIATKFRNKFKGEEDLWNQNEPVGGCAKLKRGGRYVYYLITKEYSCDKPTYETLHSSLSAMAQHCEDNAVKELSMPQIGCGLDGLEWPRVASMIREVFKDKSVNITVYITYMYGGPWKPKKEKRYSARREHSPNWRGTASGKPDQYGSAPGKTDWNRSAPGKTDWNCSAPGKSDWNHSAPGKSDWNQTAPGKTDWNRSAPGKTDRNRSAPGKSDWNHSAPGKSDWNQTAPRKSDRYHSAPGDHDWDHSAPGEHDWDHSAPGEHSRHHGAPGDHDWDHSVPGEHDRCHGAPGEQDQDHSALGESDQDCSAAGEHDRRHGAPEEHDRPQGPPEEHDRPQGASEEHDRPQGPPEEHDRPQGASEEHDRPQGAPEEHDWHHSEPGEHNEDHGAPGDHDQGHSAPGKHDQDCSAPGERDQDYGGSGEHARHQGAPGEHNQDQSAPGEQNLDQSAPGEHNQGHSAPGQHDKHHVAQGKTDGNCSESKKSRRQKRNQQKKNRSAPGKQLVLQ